MNDLFPSEFPIVRSSTESVLFFMKPTQKSGPISGWEWGFHRKEGLEQIMLSITKDLERRGSANGVIRPSKL